MGCLYLSVGELQETHTEASEHASSIAPQGPLQHCRQKTELKDGAEDGHQAGEEQLEG